uniref:Uncharacterized protein n=1 Tax=Aegilops tauschii subsp. strangulata TaxID=200361 RepID=A0A453DUM7_AEGTS
AAGCIVLSTPYFCKEVLDYRGGDETLNYIDLGLELATRVDKDKPTDDAGNSSFQGKLGPSKSSAALAYKFPPFFTCSITEIPNT